MADGDILCFNGCVVGTNIRQMEKLDIVDEQEKSWRAEAGDDPGCFGRPGSQIDDKVEFKNKFGETVAGIPVIVDFRRVLQLGQIGKGDGVISGVMFTLQNYLS